MSETIRHRRKLGGLITKPITFMLKNPELDHTVLIESDNAAARKTRAAALMYISRNNLKLTTSVKGNRVLIMHNKDLIDNGYEVDLRQASEINKIFDRRK